MNRSESSSDLQWKKTLHTTQSRFDFILGEVPSLLVPLPSHSVPSCDNEESPIRAAAHLQQTILQLIEEGRSIRSDLKGMRDSVADEHLPAFVEQVLTDIACSNWNSFHTLLHPSKPEMNHNQDASSHNVDVLFALDSEDFASPQSPLSAGVVAAKGGTRCLLRASLRAAIAELFLTGAVSFFSPTQTAFHRAALKDPYRCVQACNMCLRVAKDVATSIRVSQLQEADVTRAVAELQEWLKRSVDLLDVLFVHLFGVAGGILSCKSALASAHMVAIGGERIAMCFEETTMECLLQTIALYTDVPLANYSGMFDHPAFLSLLSTYINAALFRSMEWKRTEQLAWLCAAVSHWAQWCVSDRCENRAALQAAGIDALSKVVDAEKQQQRTLQQGQQQLLLSACAARRTKWSEPQPWFAALLSDVSRLAHALFSSHQYQDAVSIIEENEDILFAEVSHAVGRSSAALHFECCVMILSSPAKACAIEDGGGSSKTNEDAGCIETSRIYASFLRVIALSSPTTESQCSNLLRLLRQWIIASAPTSVTSTVISVAQGIKRSIAATAVPSESSCMAPSASSSMSLSSFWLRDLLIRFLSWLIEDTPSCLLSNTDQKLFTHSIIAELCDAVESQAENFCVGDPSRAQSDNPVSLHVLPSKGRSYFVSLWNAASHAQEEEDEEHQEEAVMRCVERCLVSALLFRRYGDANEVGTALQCLSSCRLEMARSLHLSPQESDGLLTGSHRAAEEAQMVLPLVVPIAALQFDIAYLNKKFDVCHSVLVRLVGCQPSEDVVDALHGIAQRLLTGAYEKDSHEPGSVIDEDHSNRLLQTTIAQYVAVLGSRSLPWSVKTNVAAFAMLKAFALAVLDSVPVGGDASLAVKLEPALQLVHELGLQRKSAGMTVGLSDDDCAWWASLSLQQGSHGEDPQQEQQQCSGSIIRCLRYAWRILEMSDTHQDSWPLEKHLLGLQVNIGILVRSLHAVVATAPSQPSGIAHTPASAEVRTLLEDAKQIYYHLLNKRSKSAFVLQGGQDSHIAREEQNIGCCSMQEVITRCESILLACEVECQIIEAFTPSRCADGIDAQYELPSIGDLVQSMSSALRSLIGVAGTAVQDIDVVCGFFCSYWTAAVAIATPPSTVEVGRACVVQRSLQFQLELHRFVFALSKAKRAAVGESKLDQKQPPLSIIVSLARVVQASSSRAEQLYCVALMLVSLGGNILVVSPSTDAIRLFDHTDVIISSLDGDSLTAITKAVDDASSRFTIVSSADETATICAAVLTSLSEAKSTTVPGGESTGQDATVRALEYLQVQFWNHMVYYQSVSEASNSTHTSQLQSQHAYTEEGSDSGVGRPNVAASSHSGCLALWRCLSQWFLTYLPETSSVRISVERQSATLR